MESHAFALNANATPWFPSEPVNTVFPGFQTYSEDNPGTQWAWVPVNFHGQMLSNGQGCSMPFTTHANVYVNHVGVHGGNQGCGFPFNNNRANQSAQMWSWDDSPWTGPVHTGFAISNNATKRFEGSSDVQDHELSSTTCGSTSSSQVSTTDSETSTAGNLPIDDFTTIPADLFADMVRAGQEARGRGQHRYCRRTQKLLRKDISDAKVAASSSMRTRLPCPSFPPPPPPPSATKRYV